MDYVRGYVDGLKDNIFTVNQPHSRSLRQADHLLQTILNQAFSAQTLVTCPTPFTCEGFPFFHFADI